MYRVRWQKQNINSWFCLICRKPFVIAWKHFECMVIFIDGNSAIAIYLTMPIKGNSPPICHCYIEQRTFRKWERFVVQKMAIKYSFGVCIHIKRTQKYTHAHTKKSTTVNKKMQIQTEHNLYNLTTLYIQLIPL